MTFAIHLLALHPGGDFPHSDALGVPAWLQWLIGLALIAAGIWIVIDTRPAKRALAAAPPEPPETGQTRDRLVASDLLTQPRRSERRVWAPTLRRAQTALRLLLFLLGVILGWYALDRARAVEAFAGFIGSDGTSRAAQLAFACAALYWVGAALVLVAPRGAALAFLGAGGTLLLLATASRWEERLEWWGVTAAARQWENAALWTAIAFGLALLSLLAGWSRSRPRDFTSV
jgi:hypothetical protein